MPRPSIAPIAAVCSLIIFVALYRSSHRAPELAPVEGVEEFDPSLLCDPLAEPGFLHYDPEDPMHTRWIPYSPSCEPAPDWVSLIAQRDLPSLSWLANRTILVLGDSVDRNGLHHMAEMLGLPRYCVPYDDFSKKGVVPQGWDERGIPWVVEIPWLNTFFTNGFMYGLDDEDNFRQQPDWHPPGKAEDRIDQLFKVHTSQLPFPDPSFISVHSGLWDLAFFGRQDRVAHLSTEIPLTHARVEWWQRRLKSLLSHVNETWPGAPIWVRKLHRVGPVGGASYDWRHTGHADSGAQETFSNFFTDIRIHTIREMQEQVVRDVGIPAYDFGENWEGWQREQQMVHPNKFPGGPVYVQALLHHIWMEAQGRDKWRLTQKRELSPLSGENPWREWRQQEEGRKEKEKGDGR